MRETSSVFCRFWHRAVTASLHSAQTARRHQLHLSGAHRGRQPLRCALCATEPPREARGACAEGRTQAAAEVWRCAFAAASADAFRRNSVAGAAVGALYLCIWQFPLRSPRQATNRRTFGAPPCLPRLASLFPPPSPKFPSFQKFPVYKCEHMC